MTPFSIKPLMPNEEHDFPTVPMYVATKDGWLVNTPTLFGVALVPTFKHPQHLAGKVTQFKLNETKLPRFIISQAHDFFRKVWHKQQTEAMVFITHHPQKQIFGLWVPEQYVSTASVNYMLPAGAIKGGWEAVGTIHSHCNFGAFHSGTDQHDMAGMPGLHITIGHVDRDVPDYAVALSANKQQFDVEDMSRIIDEDKPKTHKGFDTAPEFWLEYVKTGTAPWVGGTIGYKKPATTSYLPAHKTSAAWKPSPAAMRHWDDWDEFDERWYSKSTSDDLPPGFTQVPMFDKYFSDPPEKPVAENEDAFALYAAEVGLSEHTLDYEAVELAFLGFVLNYNITYNPKKANKWLRKQGYLKDEETDD